MDGNGNNSVPRKGAMGCADERKYKYTFLLLATPKCLREIFTWRSWHIAVNQCRHIAPRREAGCLVRLGARYKYHFVECHALASAIEILTTMRWPCGRSLRCAKERTTNTLIR